MENPYKDENKKWQNPDGEHQTGQDGHTYKQNNGIIYHTDCWCFKK